MDASKDLPSLYGELKATLSHKVDMSDATVAEAIKMIGNNKRYAGVKEAKQVAISKLSTNRHGVLAHLEGNNAKMLAKDIETLLDHKLLKNNPRSTTKEDLACLYFYISAIFVSFFETRIMLKSIGAYVGPFIECYHDVVQDIKIAAENNNKNSVVRLDRHALARLFLEDGGTLPDDEAHRNCPFCGHSFIDVPSSNQSAIRGNKTLQVDYNEKLNEFRNKGYYTKTDKTISRRAPPQPKYKPIILQCHCQQMRCIGRDGQGSCTQCMDPRTPPLIDNRGKCSCPICLCQCNRGFKKSAINTIGINKDFDALPREGKDIASLKSSASTSQAISTILATQAQLAHQATACVVQSRNGLVHPSDARVQEEMMFQGAGRAIMKSNIDLAGMQPMLGNDTRILLPNGECFDTRLLGRENGGNRQRNNRLAQSTPNGSAAAISPNTNVESSPLPSLGLFGNPPRSARKGHNKPDTLSAMNTFLAVRNVVDGPRKAKVRMPSAQSQNEVDRILLQKGTSPIDLLDDLSTCSPPSMKKACSTQETPRSDLISKAKQFLINKSTATVYNVDSDSISTPDSALGKDTEHIYTFDKNMMKDVARNVMVNVDSPKGKDLVKALDCIKPFPSTLKKRKKIHTGRK